PRELKQRPEHVLHALARRGYLCVMLEITASAAPQIEQRAPNLYRTNLFPAFLAELREQPCVLYLSWPFFTYLRRLLPEATVIYDVLDDPELGASTPSDQLEDHADLLRQADVTLFSSTPLFERFGAQARRPLLVPNGVWPEDFSGAVAAESARKPGEYVVGYVGAISELLDFDSLEAIASDPHAGLELIGPVSAFDSKRKEEIEARVAALCARSNCRHFGAVPYEELPARVAAFDVAIVPFVKSRVTDAVLPLKLFEYMSAGKPVVSTPLEAVSSLAGTIGFAASGAPFAEAVKAAATSGAHDYAPVLDNYRWDRTVEPLASFIDGHTRPVATATTARRPVAIINVNFFDWDGAELYKGGAERYVFDLARLLQREGHTVRLVQNANQPFQRTYRGVEVVGVAAGCGFDFAKLSAAYDEVLEPGEAAIASPLELACRLSPERLTVGINHGIHWDTRFNVLQSSRERRQDELFDGLRGCDCCVCVDTNFINWVRTFDWGLSQQLVFVPNYVDLEQFNAESKAAPVDPDEVVVLYPRRLYEARGLNLLMEAFARLLPEHPKLKLELCGQAAPEDVPMIEAFLRRHPGQVRWYELPMEAMPEAYRRSQIAIIPTMYAEGTSLSCIEAMATGNAIVATNVGGLPNLVIDRLNGLLINPESGELYRAVKRLVCERELREELARNGLEVARRFSKESWERSWLEVIRTYLR
ncbi:MAG: glycosyltransferase, partial [Myxococcales bacterium]